MVLKDREAREKEEMEYEMMFYDWSGKYCGSVGCGDMPPQDVERIRMDVQENVGGRLRCVLRHADID